MGGGGRARVQDWRPLSRRLCDHSYTLLHSALSMLPQCTCRPCEPRDGSTAQVGRGSEESRAAVKVLGLAEALQDPALVRSPRSCGTWVPGQCAHFLPLHGRPHHTMPTRQSQPGSALTTPLPTRGLDQKAQIGLREPQRAPLWSFQGTAPGLQMNSSSWVCVFGGSYKALELWFVSSNLHSTSKIILLSRLLLGECCNGNTIFSKE